MLLALLAPPGFLPVGVRVVAPGAARVAVSMYGDRFNIDASDVSSRQRGDGSEGGSDSTRLKQGQGWGSDSVYRRERGDNAPIDVARVESLIAERSKLRRMMDYDGADVIRTELGGMGVAIRDRDQRWRVENARRDDGPSGGGGGGRGYWSASEEYKREEGDTVPVDVARVELLLAQRTELRKSRDFSGADALRNELNLMDVTVLDREMQWFVGSREGYRGDDGGRRALEVDRAPQQERRGRFDPEAFGPLGHNYLATGGADYGSELDEATLASVHSLLAERLVAKVTREFERADTLRDQLRGMGVRVDDRVKEWSYAAPVTVDLGPSGHDYTRASDDAAALAEDAVAAVDALLAARLQARLRRRWGEADARLGELRALGVVVQDRMQLWRADGAGFPSHVRAEGEGDATPAAAALDEGRVLELLALRAAAKVLADYEAADALEDTLRTECGVIADDKRGTWRLVTLLSGYYHIGPAVDPDTTRRVGELLERRAVHVAARERQEADTLQAELAEMGIEIDTKFRSWRTKRVEGRGGGRGGGRGRGRGDGRGRGRGGAGRGGGRGERR